MFCFVKKITKPKLRARNATLKLKTITNEFQQIEQISKLRVWSVKALKPVINLHHPFQSHFSLREIAKLVMFGKLKYHSTNFHHLVSFISSLMKFYKDKISGNLIYTPEYPEHENI